MLAIYILLQLLNVPWTSKPHHSSLVGQIFLDLWLKPGMIALMKGKKIKSLSLYLNCNKIVTPSRVPSMLKPKWLLVLVLEPKLELHNSLKFGVCVIYYTWPENIILSLLLPITHTSRVSCCCSCCYFCC